MSPSQNNAVRLNRDCLCVTLDRAMVEAAFLREIDDPTFGKLIREERWHLFSNVAVFVADASFKRHCQRDVAGSVAGC